MRLLVSKRILRLLNFNAEILPICAFIIAITVFPILTHAEQGNPDILAKGAYLAKVGDCEACHSAEDSSPALAFAGGLPINSPYGIIYSTNITPDPESGIGRYSLQDFARAVREGIEKKGEHLYPAMPYPSFSGISDDDIQALYAYFMHAVKPVKYKAPETQLPFPFNQRWIFVFWNAVFVQNQRFEPQPDRSALWNRGAYLVQTLGHCGACHTPRGIAFQETAYSDSSPNYLSGSVIDNWFAANLTGDMVFGLGRWQEKDIADFLKTGHNSHFAAFGSMDQVIGHSTRYFSDNDLKAIAHYLKSLPPQKERSWFKTSEFSKKTALKDESTTEIEHPGLGLYRGFCEKCHRHNGEGESNKVPALAGNSMVLSPNAVSLIRLVLEGSKNKKPQKEKDKTEMPQFAGQFTDQQIGEVLSYIRHSWGNTAPPVTTREVIKIRKAVKKE